MPHILVTGSCGLIGSEVCRFFAGQVWNVTGIDNDHRAEFFGTPGSTLSTRDDLRKTLPTYSHNSLDITWRAVVAEIVQRDKPDLIIHAAAQPSHDLAAKIPVVDFEVNAVGTLNLLEAARQFCPESPFVFMSTNKVYGDGPNRLANYESDNRIEFYHSPEHENGIAEDFPVDACTHSLFGVSKLSADLLVQEYGRYFGMPTCCLRAGCLTGPNHAGVELHGFLSYLIKCNVEGKLYRVYGYKGKQVRDNLHSYDVARFMWEFYKAPRKAEVYNLGGGRGNSCSILEAFEMAEAVTGKPMKWEYVDQPRIGDHICYYSDLRKCKEHYPGWSVTKDLPTIFREIADGWKARL